MNRFSIRALCVLMALAFSLPAMADELADKAVGQCNKAAALWKSAGRDKAIATLADPANGFKDKDVVVYVQGLDGVMIHHPWNPGFIGKDLKGMQDPDGKLWVQEMIKTAKEKGSGWVEYKFINANTKKIEPRAAYVERVDDVLVGCAISKN